MHAFHRSSKVEVSQSRVICTVSCITEDRRFTKAFALAVEAGEDQALTIAHALRRVHQLLAWQHGMSEEAVLDDRIHCVLSPEHPTAPHSA